MATWYGLNQLKRGGWGEFWDRQSTVVQTLSAWAGPPDVPDAWFPHWIYTLLMDGDLVGDSRRGEASKYLGDIDSADTAVKQLQREVADHADVAGFTGLKAAMAELARSATSPLVAKMDFGVATAEPVGPLASKHASSGPLPLIKVIDDETPFDGPELATSDPVEKAILDDALVAIEDAFNNDAVLGAVWVLAIRDLRGWLARPSTRRLSFGVVSFVFVAWWLSLETYHSTVADYIEGPLFMVIGLLAQNAIDRNRPK